MRTRPPIALTVLALQILVIPGLAHAGPEKVSPLLRNYTHTGLEVAYDHMRTLETIGVLGTAAGNTPIPCLVQGDVTRAELENLGVTVGTQAGTVFTATIPGDRILAVSDLPGIVRIEPARKAKLTLDSATSDTNVRPEVYGAGSPPWTGNTGAGVLVGNVDSGIDYTHADFKTPLGTTRFDRIWDQTVGGMPPAGYGYGTEWSTASIQAETATVNNPDGHGTHVLGILGGDGSSTGTGSAPAYTFAGVAPEATLIHVKSDFTDAGILDGTQWIFQRAAALGLPAVVNISLGSQVGPHDGTDPFEVGLSALTGPGKVIVTSASNDRGAQIHARGTVPGNGQPSSLSIQFVVDPYTPTPMAQNDFVLFTGWYDGSDNYSVTVTGPTGGTLTMTKGNQNAVATTNGAIQIENAVTTPSNGDCEVFIAIYDNTAPNTPDSGTWTITFNRVTSTQANIDVWMYYNTMPARFTTNVTDDVTIGNPACGANVISVAAYTTKTTWPSRNGSNYQWNPVPTLFELADFSGRGPTRTGGQKPDLAAPGFGVVSALSDDVAINSGTIPLILPGDVHWIQAGTSMSAPMVAGLAALILAKEGPLTPTEVLTRMSQYARTDGFTGPVWNEDWGWGKMNAEAADVQEPSVSVIAPNGSEVYSTGVGATIQWTAADNFGVDAVDLHFSTDSGTSYPNLIASGVQNTGSYEWVTPVISSSTVRVRVRATDTASNIGEDASNADFTIGTADVTPPSVTVQSPDGGETFLRGAWTTITWSASDSGMKPGVNPLAAAEIAGVDSVAIFYSLDNGASWVPEAAGLENTGSYPWQLPGVASDSARVRIRAWDPSANPGEDESDAVFVISEPAGTMPSPIPRVLTLAQSRPNPARATTGAHIEFGLPQEGHVRMNIYDAQGGLVATVADRRYPAGVHQVRWNGRSAGGGAVPSGIYFYRLETAAGELNRKLILVR